MGEQKMISYWSYPGMSNRPNQISINKLFRCIELVMGLSEEELKSKKRFSDYVDARQMFMIFLRKHSKLSTTVIGKHLNRDHSTVVYGQKTGFNLLQTDAQFRERYENIEYMTLNPFIFNPDGSQDESVVGYNPKVREPETIKSIKK